MASVASSPAASPQKRKFSEVKTTELESTLRRVLPKLPDESSGREAMMKLDGAKAEWTANLQMMQNLQDRLDRLEMGSLVHGRASYVVGASQFRDDFVTTLMDMAPIPQVIYIPTALNDGKKPSNDKCEAFALSTEGDAADSRTTYNSSTRVDRFAAFHDKTTFGKYLDNRGLKKKLFSCWSFLQNGELRGPRNAETHDEQWKQFAYSVVDRASKRDRDCEYMLYYLGQAFEFTYGKTWEEAAELAEEPYKEV